MKKFNQKATVLLASLVISQGINAQCGTNIAGGSAFNALTIVRNSTNPVAVNKNLNTVAFIHRNNPAIFGGSSGNYRYDISTNGGTTWSTNQGILNPLNTYPGRYPNAVIHNPSGNTTPSSAYLGYLGATTNVNTGVWNGMVTGVRQLSGSGNTESYNQPGMQSYLIPGSMVKGAPGTFWAIDLSSDGANATGNVQVYKGTWNSNTNNINWASNTVLSPPFTYGYYGSYPAIGDCNIAFDPTGTYGWICLMSDLSSINSYYVAEPVFYSTSDGGATWNGPMEVNMAGLTCITSNISFGSLASTTFEGDLAVDVYGNPHLLTMIGSGSGAYGIYYNQWHHMVDFTQENGVWTAYDVSAVTGAPTSYTGSVSGPLSHGMTPQVSRSADGHKIFFSWTDNSQYSIGSPNTSPNMFSRALDVQQKKWTAVKDFSSCNANVNGRILYLHTSEEVLEPSSGLYKLAPVYAAFTAQGDPDQATNFSFLDNATFSSADFSVSQPSIAMSIVQGSAALICPGTNLNLQISGGPYSEIFWSNYSSLSSTQVSSQGVYSVTVRSGCILASDSIAVNVVSLSITSNSAGVCEGSPVTLSVTGNAYSYAIAPLLTQGTTFTVFPTSSMSSYTIVGTGDGNCIYGEVTYINVYPTPTVLMVSNHPVICNGEEAVLQATGNNISLYNWSSGATTFSASVSPAATTLYSLTVYSSDGCSKLATYTQLVDACTGISTVPGNEALILYPNPAGGSFTIKAASELSVQIMNELGQVIRTAQLNDSNGREILVNDLAKGIYFVTAQSSTQNIKQKLVIE